MGESATNRIDVSCMISASLRPSETRKRHGSMQLQHRSDDLTALDEGPLSKLANGLLQLGLRIHHDWSITGDALAKRFR
jgi:hypothetical protein